MRWIVAFCRHIHWDSVLQRFEIADAPLNVAAIHSQTTPDSRPIIDSSSPIPPIAPNSAHPTKSIFLPSLLPPVLPPQKPVSLLSSIYSYQHTPRAPSADDYSLLQTEIQGVRLNILQPKFFHRLWVPPLRLPIRCQLLGAHPAHALQKLP